MKRLVIAIATVFAAAAFVSTATADGPIFQAEGFGCGVLDRDGSGVFTTNSSVTWFDSGKVLLYCTAQGTAGNSVVQFTNENTGLLCGVIVTVTDEWKNRIGRNGEIQLTCKGFLNPGGNNDAASSGGLG